MLDNSGKTISPVSANDLRLGQKFITVQRVKDGVRVLAYKVVKAPAPNAELGTRAIRARLISVNGVPATLYLANLNDGRAPDEQVSRNDTIPLSEMGLAGTGSEKIPVTVPYSVAIHDEILSQKRARGI